MTPTISSTFSRSPYAPLYPNAADAAFAPASSDLYSEDAKKSTAAVEENRQFLATVRKLIETHKYQEAHKTLSLLRFDFCNSDTIHTEIYDCLFLLLPHLDPEYFVTASIVPELLKRTSTFYREQQQLAFILATRHHTQSLEATGAIQKHHLTISMHYYARALLIADTYNLNDLSSIHVATSRLLFLWIKVHLIDSRYLIDKLLEARSRADSQLFTTVFYQVHTLKKYCCDEKDLEALKQIFFEAGTNFNENTPQSFLAFAPKIREAINEKFSPSPPITKVFLGKLNEFRKTTLDRYKLLSSSTTDNLQALQVLEFQKYITKNFKEFLITNFLHDGINFLGLSNAAFDLRLLGSAARDEICPYSDLEWMILIPEYSDIKRSCITECSLLIQWLQFQLLCLGETPQAAIPIFSSLGPYQKSGLHLDLVDATQNADGLIESPQKLAKKQATDEIQNYHREKYTVNRPENVILKSASLFQTTPTLDDQYQKAIATVLFETRRHERAITRIKERCADFYSYFPLPINQMENVDLKKHFVETLFHTLGDIALFFGIGTYNTLEIIDKLPIFTKNSRILLKQAIAALYMIRVGVHLNYKEQKEIVPIRSLKESDQQMLLQIYWLILTPLFGYLAQQECLSDTNPIDLPVIAFTNLQTFSSGEQQKWALSALICSLVEKQAPIQEYEFYYKALSNKEDTTFEFLRNSFMEILQTRPLLSAVVRKLSCHASPLGLRYSEIQEQNQLKKELYALSTTALEEPRLSKNSFKVVIKTPEIKEPIYLKYNHIDTLLDVTGHIRLKSLRASHSASALYFHEQPQDLNQISYCPGKEYSATTLMRRLFGRAVPASTLAEFKVTQGIKVVAHYVVLITHVPDGKPLDQIDFTTPLNINSKQLSELFLSIPLMGRPEIAGSYLLTSSKDEDTNSINTLVCMHNYAALSKPVKRITTKEFQIHLDTTLFRRFPHFVLDTAAIHNFLLLKPELIIMQWLRDLDAWNKNLRLFYTQLPSELSDPRCLCLLDAAMSSQLLMQLHCLQSFLKQRQAQSQPIYAEELLRECIAIENGHIIQVGALILQQYQGSIQHRSSLKDRHPDKKITISNTNPHLSLYNNIPNDTAEAYYFSPEEQLQEIELLVTLKLQGFIFVQSSNNAISLENGFRDLSQDLQAQNAALQCLVAHKYEKLNLSCCMAVTDHYIERFCKTSGSALKYLDLRNCKQISHAVFSYLEQNCPNIEEIYISNTPNFLSIGKVALSKQLFIKRHTFLKLKILHISDCDKLEYIKITAPHLLSLVATNNLRLKHVEIESGGQFTTDFTNSPYVTTKFSQPTQLKKLAAASNTVTTTASGSIVTTSNTQLLARTQTTYPHIAINQEDSSSNSATITPDGKTNTVSTNAPLNLAREQFHQVIDECPLFKANPTGYNWHAPQIAQPPPLHSTNNLPPRYSNQSNPFSYTELFSNTCSNQR